jgi:hypothetical protein
MPRMEKLVN